MQSIKRLLVLTLLAFSACNGEDKKAPSLPGASDLFLDYEISAEEGSENAIIMLQFRKSDKDATSIALDSGSQVSFDGELLVEDSARLAGTFYEVQRPLAGFEGEHVISYTNKNGQTYEERFSFTPLQLISIPPAISRKDLMLNLEGSKDNHTIQVTVTDTSFKTIDVNENYKVKDGQIALESAVLQKLANGPIALELFSEEIKPLPNGRLLLTYTIRRELELKD